MTKGHQSSNKEVEVKVPSTVGKDTREHVAVPPSDRCTAKTPVVFLE